MRVAATVGLPLAAAAIVVFGLQFATSQPWTFHPWQIHEISSETGVSTDYPLARGKGIFVVHGQGDHQHIACITRRTGAVVWTNALNFSKCRLAADDQRVYVLANRPGGDWICAALSARNGAMLWSQPASEIPAGSPSH